MSVERILQRSSFFAKSVFPMVLVKKTRSFLRAKKQETDISPFPPHGLERGQITQRPLMDASSSPANQFQKIAPFRPYTRISFERSLHHLTNNKQNGGKLSYVKNPSRSLQVSDFQPGKGSCLSSLPMTLSQYAPLHSFFPSLGKEGTK